MENSLSADIGAQEEKSQKRPARQRRRKERRMRRLETAVKPVPEEKKEPLSRYLWRFSREIRRWLKNYEILMCRADDAGVPCVKEMPRTRRNDFIQEYVDIGDFLQELDTYLDSES